MRITPVFLLMMSGTLLSACAGLGRESGERDGEPGAIERTGNRVTGQETTLNSWPAYMVHPLDMSLNGQTQADTSGYPDDLWQRIRSGFAMKDADNPRVAAELRFYSQRPQFMQRVGERATPYLHYIVEKVDRRGMPMEVALLPVVESAYQVFAYSHGRAAGIWQFIPGTGRHYGLQQTWWYDGRRDVIASTEAALNYLDRLQEMFDGDWELAFAAYNAGEGTVMRAIRRNRELGRPTDYWNLPLPRETRHYVPRLLAVKALVEDPRRHDIALPEIPDEPYLDVVDVGSQIDLALAAELAELDIDELYRLNPGFNRWATDPDGPHHLALPLDRSDAFRQALAEVSEADRVRWLRHKIAPGENLGQIARRHGTTVDIIQEANGLGRSHIIRAGSHLLVPASSQPASHYSLSAEQRLARSQNRQRRGHRVEHTVRRGDTFWGLSRQYGVGIRELAGWNNMAPGDTLRPGQTLVLWTGSERHAGNAPPSQGEPIMQRIQYTVRRGDSLSRIAQRFRVSVASLRQWNNLREGAYLQPGQRLTLHVDVRAQSGSI